MYVLTFHIPLFSPYVWVKINSHIFYMLFWRPFVNLRIGTSALELELKIELELELILLYWYYVIISSSIKPMDLKFSRVVT